MIKVADASSSSSSDDVSLSVSPRGSGGLDLPTASGCLGGQGRSDQSRCSDPGGIATTPPVLPGARCRSLGGAELVDGCDSAGCCGWAGGGALNTPSLLSESNSNEPGTVAPGCTSAAACIATTVRSPELTTGVALEVERAVGDG